MYLNFLNREVDVVGVKLVGHRGTPGVTTRRVLSCEGNHVCKVDDISDLK